MLRLYREPAGPPGGHRVQVGQRASSCPSTPVLCCRIPEQPHIVMGDDGGALNRRCDGTVSSRHLDFSVLDYRGRLAIRAVPNEVVYDLCEQCGHWSQFRGMILTMSQIVHRDHV